MLKVTNDPRDWSTRGKPISQLIEELKRFENQSLEVRISVDGGRTHQPISLVGKKDGACVLMFVPSEH